MGKIRRKETERRRLQAVKDRASSANPTKTAPRIATAADVAPEHFGVGLWRFAEHPITLVAVAVLLGAIGLFLFTPILWVCGLLVLIAFYRSKAVTRYSWKWQVPSYLVLAILTAVALYWLRISVKPVDDLRAHLHCRGVQLFPSDLGPVGETLGIVNAKFFMKNIGRSDVLKRAVMRIRVDISKPMSDAEENELFNSGFGARGTFTRDNEIPTGDELVLSYKMPFVVTPSEWQKMKEGKNLIYVTASADFSDKYGRRISEFCRVYKWPELQTSEYCEGHNRVYEAKK